MRVESCATSEFNWNGHLKEEGFGREVRSSIDIAVPVVHCSCIACVQSCSAPAMQTPLQAEAADKELGPICEEQDA